MEWKNKVYEVGDRRIKTTFLLLPEKLNGITKWLEFAKIEQEYYIWEGCGDWSNITFV